MKIDRSSDVPPHEWTIVFPYFKNGRLTVKQIRLLDLVICLESGLRVANQQRGLVCVEDLMAYGILQVIDCDLDDMNLIIEHDSGGRHWIDISSTKSFDGNSIVFDPVSHVIIHMECDGSTVKVVRIDVDDSCHVDSSAKEIKVPKLFLLDQIIDEFVNAAGSRANAAIPYDILREMDREYNAQVHKEPFPQFSCIESISLV